jgi:hypothetical protein
LALEVTEYLIMRRTCSCGCATTADLPGVRGGPTCYGPQVFTVRTLHGYTGGGPDLVWYGAAGTRTKKEITAFGILDNYAGVLVRDGTTVDPKEITKRRKQFDQAAACGISANLSRPWTKDNHPGLVLARRLKRKVDQVWLFTSHTDVPPTNNGSKAAIRGFKLAEKISGCWRTLTTLRRHRRIRSYLVTAHNHKRPPLNAIRDALNGTTWMPPRNTTTPTLAA